MHLVLVSSLLPVDQPASGFDIANRTVLDGLRAAGHKVSMLGYQTPGTHLAEADGVELLGEMEITNARVSRATRFRWLATAFAAGTTVSSAKMLACGRRRMEAALRSLAPFDGLILNSVQLPGAYLQIFERFPSVFVAHNVEAASARENAQVASSRLDRLLFRREARLVGALEQRLCRTVRFVWTLADEDRGALGVDNEDRSATLPLVTRIGPPQRSEAARSLQYDLGMVGTWSWRPNRTGLDWFLDEVVPRLPEDFSIAIAGNLPHPPAPKHPGVRYLGRVPDARDFLRGCAVVPLASTAGTGVPLKTIEAFEMGLPAVATPGALRGIRTVPENCAVASDAAGFAGALVDRVGAVRAGTEPPQDGRSFHAGQLQGLRQAIDRGLARLCTTDA